VGLVQNQVEGVGVATISMTVQPHITASVGTPRSMYLRYPAGNQVGEAGKPIQQRAILTAALEAAYQMQAPGSIVELPYRWRRFPVPEEPVFKTTSEGPRHPQAEAVGEALDNMARLTREYRSYLEGRLSQEEASDSPILGLSNALRTQIGRVELLEEVLDTATLDALREMVNSIATLELRASGKFV
jgi:D-proline reductase (dithiol) PrdB